MATSAFFCGFVAKKVTAAMLSPSSMVAVFFFFCSLWFSSLELTINTELVVFCLGLKVVLAGGRKLKKSGGGELEVHKQNVVASNEKIVEQNVIVADEVIVEQNVVASDEVVVADEAIVEQNVATSDEAIVDQNVITSDEAIVDQNVVTSDEAIVNQNVIASNEPIVEQNGALS
jgi:hypothetical protein